MWFWIAVLTIASWMIWGQRRKKAEARQRAVQQDNRGTNPVSRSAPQGFEIDLTSTSRQPSNAMPIRGRFSAPGDVVQDIEDDQVLASRFKITEVAGRFLCRGYSFTTMAQAQDYARRLNAEMAVPLVPVRRALPVSVPVTSALPPAAEPDLFSGLNEPDKMLVKRYGICAIGERFSCRGYTFASLDQALGYARRMEGEAQAPEEPIPVRTPVARLGVEAKLPSTRSDWLSNLSDDYRQAAIQYGVEQFGGGYRCQGRQFNSLPQAINHALELRAKADAETVVPQTASKPQVVTQPTWFGLGSSVNIAGIHIESPMIYVGVDPDGLRPSRYLLDPRLKVAQVAEDREGQSFGYWPSFNVLSPAARRTYLEWLECGRPAGYGIGYVFLFFYGLERRLLTEQAEDASEIVAEVIRLRELYGDNWSFGNYSNRLLEAANLIAEGELKPPVLSPDLRSIDFEIPFGVRRYLGERLSLGLAFDADDTLRWLLSSPETYLNTPGRRCFDELVALWRVRFALRHPDGLQVRAPKRKLSTIYRSASSEFEVKLSAGNVPDIAAVTAPLSGLRDLLLSCQQDLDALSRLLLRKPEARTSLEGALCLPHDLQTEAAKRVIAPVRSRLVEMAGSHGFRAVKTSEVLSLFGLVCEGAKVPAAQQKQLASMLDRLGYAFEPDRRHSDCGLETGGHMVVYEGRGGACPDGDRTAYLAARTKVEIAILAAASDGEVVRAELDQISAELEADDGLTVDERIRLGAHAVWLSRDLPRQQAAMKRLAGAPEALRQAAARSAVAAVVADGRIIREEVGFLEKLHKALGIPEGEVYAALHRGAGTETLASAPTAPVPASTHEALSFDQTRLDRLREETSQVSALLSSIFQEEVAPAPAVPAPPVSSEGRFQGLEARHAALLAGLLEAGGGIDIDRFDADARALKLLPDGAIETINEWAFDAFDEPLLEVDDQVILLDHLRVRLIEMERAE